jgi:hypothetical protein
LIVSIIEKREVLGRRSEDVLIRDVCGYFQALAELWLECYVGTSLGRHTRSRFLLSLTPVALLLTSTIIDLARDPRNGSRHGDVLERTGMELHKHSAARAAGVFWRHWL